jgi:hypothetical protein
MMKKKKLYIEKVELSDDGSFLGSDVVLATKKQIKDFKSKPCNHSLTVDKLIYDEPGYLYDSRYCGVCDAFIDLI